MVTLSVMKDVDMKCGEREDGSHLSARTLSSLPGKKQPSPCKTSIVKGSFPA